MSWTVEPSLLLLPRCSWLGYGRARCNLALNGSDLMSLETSDELAAIRQQLSESGHLTTDFWVGLVDNNGVNFAPGPAWLNDWGDRFSTAPMRLASKMFSNPAQ